MSISWVRASEKGKTAGPGDSSVVGGGQRRAGMGWMENKVVKMRVERGKAGLAREPER